MDEKSNFFISYDDLSRKLGGLTMTSEVKSNTCCTVHFDVEQPVHRPFPGPAQHRCCRLCLAFLFFRVLLKKWTKLKRFLNNSKFCIFSGKIIFTPIGSDFPLFIFSPLFVGSYFFPILYFYPFLLGQICSPIYIFTPFCWVRCLQYFLPLFVGPNTKIKKKLLPLLFGSLLMLIVN